MALGGSCSSLAVAVKANTVDVLPEVGVHMKSTAGGAFGGGSGPARRYTVTLVALVRGCSKSTKPTPAAVVAKDALTVIIPFVALRLYSADGARCIQDQWIGIDSVGARMRTGEAKSVRVRFRGAPPSPFRFNY